MTDPATARVPTHEDTAASATPFHVIGSDDAGYCVDGVCILPADQEAPRAVHGSTERADDHRDAQVDVVNGLPD